MNDNSISSLQFHTHLLSMTYNQSTLNGTVGGARLMNDMYLILQNSHSTSRERGLGGQVGQGVSFYWSSGKISLLTFFPLAFH